MLDHLETGNHVKRLVLIASQEVGTPLEGQVGEPMRAACPLQGRSINIHSHSTGRVG